MACEALKEIKTDNNIHFVVGKVEVLTLSSSNPDGSTVVFVPEKWISHSKPMNELSKSNQFFYEFIDLLPNSQQGVNDAMDKIMNEQTYKALKHLTHNQNCLGEISDEEINAYIYQILTLIKQNRKHPSSKVPSIVSPILSTALIVAIDSGLRRLSGISGSFFSSTFPIDGSHPITSLLCFGLSLSVGMVAYRTMEVLTYAHMNRQKLSKVDRKVSKLTVEEVKEYLARTIKRTMLMKYFHKKSFSNEKNNSLIVKISQSFRECWQRFASQFPTLDSRLAVYNSKMGS